NSPVPPQTLHSFPTRRSSDLSISHDSDILEAMVIQSLSYRLDLSIYHRRGTDYVGSFLRVAYGDAPKSLQGLIIVNLSVSYDPAVAVVDILAHADVCHDDKIAGQFAL